MSTCVVIRAQWQQCVLPLIGECCFRPLSVCISSHVNVAVFALGFAASGVNLLSEVRRQLRTKHDGLAKFVQCLEAHRSFGVVIPTKDNLDVVRPSVALVGMCVASTVFCELLRGRRVLALPSITWR